MTDTQWPRFIVFHQEKPVVPHVYAGSVHAPDAEMALLNARDVFVRRPACVSLWVVPAALIFSKTAEELALNPDWFDKISNSVSGKTPEGISPPLYEMERGTGGEDQTYCLFEKRTQKGVNAYVGDIEASSPELAMKKALETIADHAALVWWVFPEDSITRSTPEDIEILFAPAATKDYRDQAHFPTEAIMQKIKSRTQETHES
jgi:ring-1,2-phenylacetyl-CoA epoxidase subunit PaaB